MTNKTTPTDPKPASFKGKNPKSPEPLQNKEKFLSIDEKMQRLRKKREKLHMNESLFFTKEVQRILEDEFSLELALVVLEKTWPTASKSQKEEWRKCVPSFRASFIPPYEQKSQTYDPALEQI
ncbi:MAG: hypothetical protein KBD36_03215 [Alphaproteobacteria bacterium]|nr:hypothetical protein [Alphaproteobacteria bacterium]MBP9776835.1 hypothetical protein [Alphaproteobacteria bacterium]